MAFNLATVFAFIVASGVIFLVILLFGWLIRPKHHTQLKGTTYECGELPFGSAWFNFNNRFYLIALVFVVFDVEVALVVPVAVVFRNLVAAGHGLLAFAEMFFFLTVLFVALIYVWAHGDIRWIRALSGGECQEVEIGRKE